MEHGLPLSVPGLYCFTPDHAFPCCKASSTFLLRVGLKANSHISCHTHAVPLPCRAARGLEYLSHSIYTVRPCLIHTCHAMLRPCRSSWGHGTGRPSRDGLWTTCLLSASSGYLAEFHEGCYQKHYNLRCRWAVWNQTMFFMDKEKCGSSTLQKRRFIKWLD